MIGVSFTGHDGRRSEFSVQGAEDAAKRMSNISDGSRREAAGDAMRLFQSVRRQQVKQPAFPQEQQKEKLMPGGSVVHAPNGDICLRGEELNPLVPGTKVYGAKNGEKGFFSFDEIDPPVRGAVVGKDVGDDSQSFDANDAKKDAPDGTAWALRVQTDERADKDNATGLVTVYKYFRLLYFSASGRAVGCSGEWREVAFSFLPGAGGGGNGRYGVMLFSDAVQGDPVHPIPDAFAFGPEASLDTWNAEKSRFDCNYDESGNVLASPPVKVIAVATCPGGEPPSGGG